MSHVAYVAAAYGLSALLIGGLLGWILVERNARRRELVELEASGLRRRSDKGASA